MIVNTLNSVQKELIAGEGKVLRNHEEFEDYPTRVIVNINDDSWFDIDFVENANPEIIIENEDL